jgi:hypothetical protein
MPQGNDLVGTSVAAEEAVKRVQAEFNKLSAEILEIQSAVNAGTQGWTGGLATDFREVIVPQAMKQWSEFAGEANRILVASLEVQDRIQRAGGNRGGR